MPHHAPDQNPFVDEFVKLYHLPREAVLGYRETLYPEYRKKITSPSGDEPAEHRAWATRLIACTW